MAKKDKSQPKAPDADRPVPEQVRLLKDECLEIELINMKRTHAENVYQQQMVTLMRDMRAVVKRVNTRLGHGVNLDHYRLDYRNRMGALLSQEERNQIDMAKAQQEAMLDPADADPEPAFDGVLRGHEAIGEPLPGLPQ